MHAAKEDAEEEVRNIQSHYYVQCMPIMYIAEHNHYKDLELKGDNVRSNTVLTIVLSS